MPSGRTWQEAAASAQKRRDDTVALVGASEVPSDLPLNVIPIPQQLLSSREVKITEAPTEKILAQLANADWSSEEVTRAFLRRAAIAQKLVNCVTELLPARAIERARQLDDHLKEHGKPVGPLHGLPISVKEYVAMQGLDLNWGYCSWVGRIADDDALILKILWRAGAVFHARTTQPQTVMHLETSSNVYGVTVNPFNRELTAGGSSGGEGALIGLRGSCLGIGSDIGGSIRSPAANNGIYGFKPTSRRLPISGVEPIMGGVEPIVGAMGPLSTSVSGLRLFMKVILDSQPWLQEPTLLPIPWREQSSFAMSHAIRRRKLKVAVLWDDEVVKPHPPVFRALRETVEKFKGREGIEVVDWKPYKHDKAWEIIATLYWCDGGVQEKEAIDSSGEPWRPLSEFILKDNPYVKERSVTEMFYHAEKRDEYQTQYAKHWNSTATGVDAQGVPTGMVDVILSPVGPGAAPPLNCSRYWGYTSQWNLLEYPALVFPVTKVDPSIDVKDTAYSPRNEQDQYNHNLYEPERYRDAPVSLQLIGRKGEDEKVIEAFEILQEYL